MLGSIWVSRSASRFSLVMLLSTLHASSTFHLPHRHSSGCFGKLIDPPRHTTPRWDVTRNKGIVLVWCAFFKHRLVVTEQGQDRDAQPKVVAILRGPSHRSTHHLLMGCLQRSIFFERRAGRDSQDAVMCETLKVSRILSQGLEGGWLCLRSY